MPEMETFTSYKKVGFSLSCRCWHQEYLSESDVAEALLCYKFLCDQKLLDDTWLFFNFNSFMPPMVNHY